MIYYEKLLILGHAISSKKNLVIIRHVFIILFLDKESEVYIKTKNAIFNFKKTYRMSQWNNKMNSNIHL